MFSEKLLNSLKKLSSFTDSVILRTPETILVSPAADIIARIDTTDCGFNQLEIFELKKFLGILDIFKNSEIRKESNSLIFRSSNKTASFTLADLEALSEFDKTNAAFSILETPNVEIVAEFQINRDILNEIKKVSGIFSELNAISFESRDSDVRVGLANYNQFASTNNSFQEVFVNCSKKDFEFKIDINNLLKLYSEDYNVRVYYNSEKNAYRLRLSAQDYDIIISIMR